MWRILLAGGFLLLARVPVFGQGMEEVRADTTQQLPVFELGAVEVVIGPGHAPGTVSTAASVVLERGRRDLGQALELLPGISSSGVGGRNEAMVTVRGFDLRQVPVFMDGIPVYVPYDGYVDLRRFTLYDAAEVRVSRGFSSVLYGPNAMGGAINVLSRRPVQPLELDAGSGIFTGQGREAWVNVGGRLGSGYAQLSASLLEQDEFRLPDGGETKFRDNSDRSDLRASAKVGWTPGESQEIALSLSAQHGAKGVPPYAGLDPRETRRYWRWPEWNKSGASLMARTSLPRGARAQARAYYDTFTNALFSFDDALYETQTRRSSFRSYYDDYTVGGSVEVGLASGGSHVPRLALHWKEDTHRENNAGEPVQHFHDRTLSAGVEHTWRPLDGLSVIAGASVERRETLRADDVVEGEVSPFPTGEGTSFNPQIGLFHTLAVGRVRATLSRKTRFPTIKDRYSYRMGSAMPNPNLASERATHFEIGYGGEIHGVAIDLSTFHVAIGDLIQRVDSVAQNGAGDHLWQFRNLGRAHRQGVDLGVLARPLQRLTLGGNYSFLRHQNLESPDVRLTGVPRHHGYGYGEVEATRWLDLLVSMDAYGMRYASSTGLKLDGFTTIDARLAMRPRRSVELALGARNLMDVRYELTSGFPEPGRTLYTTATYTLGGSP